MQTFFEENPPSIVSGEGCWLRDDQGRDYLDGISSLWCNVHGHRRGELDQALREQIDRVAHTTLLGLRAPGADELAQRLAQLTPPGLRWTFYSESGSTAVEIALKIAFQYWRNRQQPRRTRFVTLRHSYHGDTVGSVSLGGIDLFHQIFSPLLFDSLHVPSPHCARCPLGLRQASCDLACAATAEETLAAHEGEVAALVMEPLVQGAAGIIVHPEGYLARIRQACDRHQVLLICDEVATGFGRTGRLFACEHESVSPDILCLAKGLTGGYLPLAATVTTEDVFDAFLGDHAENKQFFHGHTFTGNALACAAALASLDIFQREALIEGLPAKMDLLAQGLAPLGDHPHVFEVRRRGLMVGIELSQDPAADKSYAPELRMGHRVALAARRRGVIVRPLGNVVVLMPALAMTEDQIQLLTSTVGEAIEEATRLP
jgi:adenosylmethionine-8-amino-7-oxononanoate aminotransferase